MFKRNSSNLSSCSACFVFFLTLISLLPQCHVPSIHPHLFFSPPLSSSFSVCMFLVSFYSCVCVFVCVAWTCLNWRRPPRRNFKRWVFRMLASLSAFSIDKVLVLLLEPLPDLEPRCISPPHEPVSDAEAVNLGYQAVFYHHHLVAMKTTLVTRNKTWAVQGI